MLAARGALRWGRLPAAGAGMCSVQPRGPPRLPPLVVDLRSDTVTQPCAAMRSAMARAAVGDDDYGEDPTVNVMCHCQRRGAQVILGRDSHLHVYEHGGVAQALPDLPDGTFDLELLELTIREAHGSRYHPRPELVCLENTHSSAGGRVLPLAYLQQVRGLADRYGLQVHMDGARLMNAAVAQNMEPAQITQHCDSVALCFSKGLGAPAGAVLAGRKDFVADAWRMRKLLGGGMRQAGVLAAAALVGLERMGVTLRRDHDNAWRFAEGIQELNSPLCSVNLTAVETNIVMVNISGAYPSPVELCEHLRAVSEEELAQTGHAVSVLLFPWSAHTVRAVWHCDISARDTELAKKKLEFVARKCQEKLTLGLRPTPPSARGA
ncbi:uncharacterized protein LOC130599284 isoform X4 [Pezoporus wallicus]|uniref:uncharacterized protein LOC130599284 isoform X4 n=1 Tax=Pezoporus wallicus TaxID=35540 RepID=UPI00254EB34E|nr:uncharacterized protein LOC130599284 isoform X4 [Pezoporus wallicus]